MQKTNVYGLSKPESTDFYNVEDFNNNFEVIDNKLSRIENAVGKTTKNLIPYPYYETTHTENGIMWTDNGDGIVSANGTAIQNSEFSIIVRVGSTFLLSPGVYHLSGCPSGGGNSSYRLNVGRTNDSGLWEQIATDMGDGATFEITENTGPLGLNLYVLKNTTVENIVFKPMIERGNVATEYEPYVQTVSNAVSHISDKENPHEVTKVQVGLSNVPNVSTNNQTPTYTVPSALTELVSGEKLSAAMGKMAKAVKSLLITRGTLAAGETSITIEDARVTEDSVLSFYTSIYGVNPSSVTVATGSVTLTFDAQSVDMEVGVRVDG